MSDPNIKQVSAHTGTFASLKSTSDTSRVGSGEPEPGKKLPEREQVDLESFTSDLNVSIEAIGRDLRFQVDMMGGTAVIQVLDRETGEIIRQIPPENAKTYVSDIGRIALRLYDEQI